MYSVLIIDDDEIIRITAEAMLLDMGHLARVAPTGDAGIKIFEEHAEQIDIVFLDVNLPDIAGKDVLLSILAVRPDVPVLLITGNLNEAAEELLKLGAVGALQKPFRLQAMADTIASLVEMPE